MKRFIPTALFILVFASANANAFSDTNNIPIFRESWHHDIKVEQINCDKLDGKEDGMLRSGSNDAINAQISDALFRKINEIRNWIEVNDAQIPTNNDKVRYLKYVADLLIYFRVNKRERSIKIDDLPELIKTADNIMKAKAEGKSILPFIDAASYPIAKICNQIFTDEEEKKEASKIVYLKFISLYPDKILQTITPFSEEPFADSLISIACKLNPEKFYSYAGAPNSAIGRIIYKSKDNMVIKVAALSQTPNALLYFPFLDDILSERQSIESIKKYVGNGEESYDSVGYYKLLVNTAVAYYKRMGSQLRDTPIAYYGKNGFIETLRSKGYEHFIKHINNLHDEGNLAIRMKAIQPLSAQELYYMIALGENDIYTSSYKHSFNRLMQLLGKKPRTDSLLLSVNFDRFKKFIKMAANYNKLDSFLKLMPANRSKYIMEAFVAGLDGNNLEDAVDVADSYSSITDKKLLQSMLQNVIDNEARAIQKDNKQGIVVYGLLKTIFQSFNDSSVNLTKEIGIPPIFEVTSKYMQNNTGKIVEQVYFYGDKDGKDFYPKFRATFSPKEWAVVEKKEWMEASSIKGNIVVYANKPLDSDANLDDTAQVHLGKYLVSLGLSPTMVVHRGHSYWLQRTMDRMPGDAKIVLLGSCGGYQNLNKILDINPDAHIISTKEIGAGDINTPLFTYMNQAFMNGGDLSWKKMWATLGKSFSKDQSKSVRDSWESYVPPFKNLGAIFLKAYSLKMNSN
jgi:hypothetical protein